MNTTPRRSFLRGLAALPLVGGGISLIGQPTAAAVLVTPALLDSYDAWLHFERRALLWRRFGKGGLEERHNPDLEVVWHHRPTGRLWESVRVNNPGGRADHDNPASRAAVILSAAGVPLMGGRDA